MAKFTTQIQTEVATENDYKNLHMQSEQTPQIFLLIRL